MHKKILSLIFGMTMVVLFSSSAFPEPLTPKLCKKKVIAAAKLLKKKGKDAFAELKDPKGPFIFADGKGYIWIHNLDGIMIMHPIKPALDGKGLMDMRDTNGVYLFVAMNEIVEEKGAGWIPYVWPKPGKKESSPKVSYVMLVEVDGHEYVVGSGMYDITAKDIKKQFPGDAIYE
ncbi:MAG: hypothetical protein GY710_21560 [Desulfobacteraceae bacterium]|nr:hypothetical protein [Desulfobacteraceae bacterium]